MLHGATPQVANFISKLSLRRSRRCPNRLSAVVRQACICPALGIGDSGRYGWFSLIGSKGSRRIMLDCKDHQVRDTLAGGVLAAQTTILPCLLQRRPVCDADGSMSSDIPTRQVSIQARIQIKYQHSTEHRCESSIPQLNSERPALAPVRSCANMSSTSKVPQDCVVRRSI